MKQNKQMYEAPKVELIKMELQGVLCSSASEIKGTGIQFDQNVYGSWVMP